jgi:hypothetical protein
LIEVRLITNIAGILAFRDQYDSFIKECENAVPYCLSGWLESMLEVWCRGIRCHKHSDNLAFLIAEENGQMVALAPFLLEQKGVKQLHLNRLYWLGDIVRPLLKVEEMDFLLIDESYRDKCIVAFYKFLLNDKNLGWDVIELGYAVKSSPNLRRFLELFPQSQIADDKVVSAKIDLPDSFEKYLAGLAAKYRSDLRRCRKLLDAEFSSVEFFSTNNMADSLLSEAVRLHKIRQQEHLVSGRDRYSLFEDKKSSSAFFKLLDWSANYGIARHFWLKLDGKIAAFVLGFAFKEIYFAKVMSFDPAFKVYSPAKLLILEVIKEEIELHHTSLIDLGIGLNHVKKNFSTRLAPLVNMSIQRPRMVSRAKLTWRNTLKPVKRIVQKHCLRPVAH